MSIIQIILLLIAIETPNCKHEGEYCYCKGDNNKSWGCLQIQEQYVRDVNRIYKTQFHHQDVFNKETAKYITRLWLKHYVTPERIGRPVSVEDHIRCHNGGGNGWKKDSTLHHWAKAERILDERRSNNQESI